MSFSLLTKSIHGYHGAVDDEDIDEEREMVVEK